VSAFFVLSGFLITFLLLDEFENGGIGLFNFYARRALRIWPVYFSLILILFLSCQQSRLCRFRVTIQPEQKAGGKVSRCI
jgi:hypothetical protein